MKTRPSSASPLFEKVEETTGELEAGLYYSGRTDFDLGLVSTTSFGGDIDRFFGSIRVGYYW